MPLRIDLPEIIQLKALEAGNEGRAWLQRLPAIVDALERDWGLTLSSQLSGGTEALVVSATTRSGEDAVAWAAHADPF